MGPEEGSSVTTLEKLATAAIISVPLALIVVGTVGYLLTPGRKK